MLLRATAAQKTEKATEGGGRKTVSCETLDNIGSVVPKSESCHVLSINLGQSGSLSVRRVTQPHATP